MAQTYIHEDQANTLAARDYKQPQAVVIIDCFDTHDLQINENISTTLLSGENNKARTPCVFIGDQNENNNII